MHVDYRIIDPERTVDFDPQLEFILREMCRKVGMDDEQFEKFKPLMGQDGWYRLYEWLPHEQDEFKKFMVSYLYKSSRARKLWGSLPRNKKMIGKAVDMFLLEYGWKFSEPPTQTPLQSPHD